LFEARQAIRDAGYALVTEGYMDVVALAQMGFPQAVATLGTACTANTRTKIVAADRSCCIQLRWRWPDAPPAALWMPACLMDDDKFIKFLFLPAEHDPDSFIREFGADAFEQQVHEAMPLSQFFMREVTLIMILQFGRRARKRSLTLKPLLQTMQPSGCVCKWCAIWRR
jgi:DNA primase